MRLLRFVLFWSCAAAAVCGCSCDNPAPSPVSKKDQQPAELSMDGVLLLDVRSADEYASGHLQGALNIPHDRISDEIAAAVPDKSQRVILYCRSGRRADTALRTMQTMGYEDVVNFGGLDDAQARLSLPVETN